MGGSRLRRFAALSRGEKRLLLRAWLTVGWVRAALWSLPAARVFDVVERRAQRLLGSAHRDGVSSAKSVGWALRITSRWVPGASCLTQALAGRLLLARYGESGTVRIGVGRGSDGSFQAHAWLMAGPGVLVGDGQLEQYKVLLEIPSAGRDVSHSRPGE